MELTVKHTRARVCGRAHTYTHTHTRERERNNTQIFPVASSQQSIKIRVNYISAPGP